MSQIEDYYWMQRMWTTGNRRADVTGMRSPVRCTKCSHVYDVSNVTVITRYADCSVWKCPGCRCTVDDRPLGWGDHHYVDLDDSGYERRH
jgi:hypothetical protein